MSLLKSNYSTLFARSISDIVWRRAAARWGELRFPPRPSDLSLGKIAPGLIRFVSPYSGGGMGVPGFDFDWSDEPFHGDTGPDGRRIGGDARRAPSSEDPRALAGT
jgi:hypothetical protein